MIQNRAEWEQAVKAVARMYDQRDRAKVVSPEGFCPREDEIASIVMMIRKVEREIRDFVQTQPFSDEDYPELIPIASRPIAEQNGAGNLLKKAGNLAAEPEKASI